MPRSVRVLVASHNPAFLRLMQMVLDDLGLPVRTTADWAAVPHLAAQLHPDLVILDLVPGHERPCWLTLEALRAQTATNALPILLCPVADWLVAGHEHRLAQHGVRVWSGSFDLQELLGTVALAVQAPSASAGGHRGAGTPVC